MVLSIFIIIYSIPIMSKKYTTFEIEEQARNLHGNKYDYDFSTYVNKREKMRMFCHEKDECGNEHGEFWQSMENHTHKTNPQGCPKCSKKTSNDKKRFTKEQLNERLADIHGGIYYIPEWSEYISTTNKTTFVCLKHGNFEAYAGNILRGEKCPKCRGEELSNRFSMGIDTFKEKLFNTHGNLIETTENSIYKNNRSKIELICHHKDSDGCEHGVFYATPTQILSGCGCLKCKKDKLSKIKLKTYEEFLEKAKKIHDDKYEYDESTYKNTHTPMKIYCKEVDDNGNVHGWFIQTPHSHCAGEGCPLCKTNQMEREIKLFCEENKIKINYEQKFSWLKKQLPLSLDFYLPDYNIAIECQGEQHFRPIKWFDKSNETFEKRQKRDKLKYDLCKEHNIRILYYSTLKKYNTFLGEKVYHTTNELLKEIVEKSI